MARLVVDFDGNHGLVIGNSAVCIRIAVLHQLLQIPRLGGTRRRVEMDVALVVIIGERSGVGILFRISVAEIGLGGQDYVDAALLELRNKVVQQVQVLVPHQVAGGVGQFGVPQMQSEGVESQTRDMVDIPVNGPFAVLTLIPQRPV